jgi:hypothetical protein
MHYRKAETIDFLVRFEVTAASIKMIVLWVVAPFNLVKFTDVSEVIAASIIALMETASASETSANFTRLHGVTSQKTVIFNRFLATTFDVPTSELQPKTQRRWLPAGMLHRVVW